jgi:hypothetical protein
MDRSTPAKFYYVMETRIFRADIQSCQEDLFFGHNIWPHRVTSAPGWLNTGLAILVTRPACLKNAWRSTQETCKLCHLECLEMAEHVGFLHVGFLLAYYLTLKMEVTSFSQTLIDFYRTIQHYISQDRTLKFLLPCLFARCSDIVRPTLLTDICSCIRKVSTRAYFDISHKEFQFTDLLN